MSKQITTLLIVILVLVISMTLVASATTSLMRFSFKRDETRNLDWDIARTLFYGGPEYNYYYYNYGNIEKWIDAPYNEFAGGQTNVWIDSEIHDGYIDVDTYGNYYED